MPHTLKIEGEGTTISREITDAQLVQIMTLLIGGAPAASGSNSGVGQAGAGGTADHAAGSRPSGGEARVSPAEFLQSVTAKNNPDKIAAFVLYAKERRGEETLHRDSIPAYFKGAGLKAPGNMPRDINKAVEQGLIAPDLDDADRFYITTPGREHLHREASSTTKNGGRSRSSRSKETYQPVDLGLSSGEAQELKDFYKTKSPSNQNEHVLTVMFWLLENTSRNHLSRADIATGLRHVKERIPARLGSVISNLRLEGKVVGDGDVLALHHTGRDLVEHDLPAKAEG